MVDPRGKELPVHVKSSQRKAALLKHKKDSSLGSKAQQRYIVLRVNQPKANCELLEPA